MIATIYRDTESAPRINLLAPCILLAWREPKSTSHVAHCRLCSIRNDIGNLCSMVATVTLVHVLNHFFTPTTFNININIWRAIAFRRQNP